MRAPHLEHPPDQEGLADHAGHLRSDWTGIIPITTQLSRALLWLEANAHRVADPDDVVVA